MNEELKQRIFKRFNLDAQIPENWSVWYGTTYTTYGYRSLQLRFYTGRDSYAELFLGEHRISEQYDDVQKLLEGCNKIISFFISLKNAQLSNRLEKLLLLQEANVEEYKEATGLTVST